MRWLGGGEHASAKCAGESEAGKERCGIEIVSPGFVDDSELSVSRRVPIRLDLVDLAPLQGHFIALVAQTEYELAFRCSHVSQDTV
jgi:hypothetical protein